MRPLNRAISELAQERNQEEKIPIIERIENLRNKKISLIFVFLNKEERLYYIKPLQEFLLEHQI